MAAKRIFDVVLAGVLLIVLAPVVGVVALAVRLDLGPPVLFRQQRVGRGGAVFTMVKFRTMEMRDARCCLTPTHCIGIQSAIGVKMSGSSALLRRSGLDELPQLINILRGEMSFVGPRPLLERYNDRYTALQRRRLEAHPGITGWAQINGRTDLSWEDRLALDVWYVDNQTFGLDLRILWRTVHTSASGSGFSQSGSDTGLEFIGTGVPPGTCPVTGLVLTDHPADESSVPDTPV